MADSRRDPARIAKSPVVVAYCLMAAVAAAGLTYARVQPWAEEDVALGDVAKSVIGAIPLFATYVGARWLAARLGERYDRRTLLAGSALLIAVSLAATAQAQTAIVFGVLAATTGFLGQAETWARSLLDEATPLDEGKKEHRSFLVSSGFTVLLALYGIGFPIASESLGWREAYRVSAGLMAIIGIAALLVLPADIAPADREKAPRGVRAAAADHSVRLQARLAFVDSVVYGLMVGPATLVMGGHGLLGWAWALSTRRAVPGVTNIPWRRVAGRPFAPLASSLAMLAPFTLWAAVLLADLGGDWLPLGLLASWWALEVARFWGYGTQQATAPKAAAARAAIVAPIVLGIGVGYAQGIFAHGLGGDGLVIVLGVVWVALELPIAAAVSRRRSYERVEGPDEGGDFAPRPIALGDRGGPVATVGNDVQQGFDRGLTRQVDGQGNTLIEVEDRPRRPFGAALRRQPPVPSAALLTGPGGPPPRNIVGPKTLEITYAGGHDAVIRIAPGVTAQLSGTTITVLQAADPDGRLRAVAATQVWRRPPPGRTHGRRSAFVPDWASDPGDPAAVQARNDAARRHVVWLALWGVFAAMFASVAAANVRMLGSVLQGQGLAMRLVRVAVTLVAGLATTTAAVWARQHYHGLREAESRRRAASRAACDLGVPLFARRPLVLRTTQGWRVLVFGTSVTNPAQEEAELNRIVQNDPVAGLDTTVELLAGKSTT